MCDYKITLVEYQRDTEITAPNFIYLLIWQVAEGETKHDVTSRLVQENVLVGHLFFLRHMDFVNISHSTLSVEPALIPF